VREENSGGDSSTASLTPRARRSSKVGSPCDDGSVLRDADSHFSDPYADDDDDDGISNVMDDELSLYNGKSAASDGQADAWSRRYAATQQNVEFLGQFTVKAFDQLAPALTKFLAAHKKDNSAKKRKGPRWVHVESHGDEFSVIDNTTHDAILHRHYMHVRAYRYEPGQSIFYFVLDDLAVCVFRSGAHTEAEELFMRFHRNLDQFSKRSLQNSTEARQRALDHLSSPDVQPGTFFLRDSTSKPGCFALTLKHLSGIDHFLIETLPSRRLAFKNSRLEFADLESLILAHCEVVIVSLFFRVFVFVVVVVGVVVVVVVVVVVFCFLKNKISKL
jgi:ribosomal protein S15P/S13E